MVILLAVKASGQTDSALIGFYESVRLSKIEMGYRSFFNEISSFPVGNTLTLESDNTYIYTTCATIEKGSYKISDSRIFLHCNEKKYKTDRFNQTGFKGVFMKCKSQPAIINIRESCLEASWVLNEKRGYVRFKKNK